jgi:hypothetical protein
MQNTNNKQYNKKYGKGVFCDVTPITYKHNSASKNSKNHKEVFLSNLVYPKGVKSESYTSHLNVYYFSVAKDTAKIII